MPVYLLSDELIFPPPDGASEEGVVAIGGDFKAERLVLAYSQGIFPWPTEGFPLLWFSPDPRFVLDPHALRVSRSLKKAMRRSSYRITADTAFVQVIEECSEVPRPGQSGTWITQELIDGYLALHELGFAHSIEAWDDDELVGGLYGVSLGGCFFGESMFARAQDASKVAFVTLIGHLLEWGFTLVDCQVYTDHLARLGATKWRRGRFLSALHTALEAPTRRGKWELTQTPEQALESVLAAQAPNGG